MAFHRESLSQHGKAAFYACIFEDLKIAACSCEGIGDTWQFSKRYGFNGYALD